MLLPATPGWVSLAAVVCGVWCVVCGGGVLLGLWLVCGVVGLSPLLAEVPVCYSPQLLAGFRCRWCWAVPATPGWGPLAAVVCGVWCVVCGGGVLLGFWLVCGVVGPSPLLAEVPVCYSPPLLAGVRWRWWCVVCGVWRWCVGGVVAGVWCGRCLATPGGGSCVLLPATLGWVSLLLVVGGPRHSWLGSVGGVAVWCVVCGGGVLVGLWLVCGVVGPSPLLAEVPVCYFPPLLAGFCCRWWWAVPATPGWGPLAAVVCGVWCVVCGVWWWCVGGVGAGVWCVVVVCCWGCGWCVACGGGVLLGLWLVCGVVGPSPLLAEVPGCYSPPLLAGFRCRWWWVVPATPGWGWLAAVACGVWCVVCWWGPSPLLAEVPVCYSPPLLAGFRWRRWCVVCGVWCVAVVCCWGCGWCVVWLVPRHSWRRSLCATPRHSWLGFAAGGAGRSPPLLAAVRWRRWCVVCGVWCVAVVCCWGCGWCVVWLVPRHSWRRSLCATPRHSWLGFAGGGGVWCVVCGVWRWCVVGVVVGVWCGWSLATPGGGPCVLLPATPGWVSLPLVVGGPRHSWLGSVGGGGLWCVVCWWGPSPLLAEVPVCYSPPLLAGFRCRWWWAVPATPGWGPLAAVACGVCSCACFAWPGRAGRPPGRVLVRLTFSFGRFVFLLCLVPSGPGLPLSLLLLLPLRAGCFSRPPAAWLSVRSRLVSVSRLAVGCSLVVAPPRPSPFVSRGFRRSCLVPWWFFFFFFFSSFLFFLCSPPLSPVFSGFRPRGPWALALALFALFAFRFWALRAFVALSCFPPGCWLLSRGCCPPPPLCVSRFSFLPLGAVCRVVLCFPGCGAAPRCCALCRPVFCCRVLCCARVVPLLVAPCPLAPPVALGPCALRRCVLRCSPAVCALCCVCFVVAPWCVLLFAALPCAVCVSGCCAVRSLCSPFCAVLCFAVLVRSCCAVRVVRAAAGAWCCGALLCVVLFPVVCRGAVLGLVARGCLLVACFGVGVPVWPRGASLGLVWFAVVPCFPVSCSVVLCCRVVLCCCALLSCCRAVGACFALLWAVVLCCVVLFVGCAVFGPVVVSARCGAVFLVLCVPFLLRSVRCGALLCWLWCPASLCRVLWRCAVVWCCAVVLCCRFAVLFVLALPSCGLSCGASVVCAVVGASCCGLSLCVVVSPWAFCGVVVLLWCVVVSCCAVRCPVVSCALCRVLRCRAALRCCAVCFSFCPVFLC